VLKRISLLSLLVLAGLCGVAQPVSGQALVPHVLQLDNETLEQQGLNLAQEAAQLIQFQQPELALSRAQLATQLAPANSQVWALLGSIYLQQENFNQGIIALQRSRALEPDNAAILFALGSAYLRENEYDTAVRYLQSGLEIDPNVPGALFDLGNAYYQQAQYDEAIEQYEEAVDLDEEFWPAVNNIGLALYEQGDVEGALQQWRMAEEIDGNQAEPKLAIAIALYAQGNSLRRSLCRYRIFARKPLGRSPHYSSAELFATAAN
jgi:tetratricopeptide (TPR) repeat protein